jgi:hypothetical protein
VSISDIIQVLVVSASVAAVVVGIFAIIQAQIQARDALNESRIQTLANQQLAQGAFNESRVQALSYQKLVQDAINQGHTHSLETLYALNRPILAPRAPLPLHNNDLNWDSQHCTIRIKNVGTGVAINIWGILLPPKKPESVELPRQYCLRAHVPISQEDNDIDSYFLLEEKKYYCDEVIEKRNGTSKQYSLCPPSPDQPSDAIDGKYAYVARLTLTYTDVFGRKHASIYDHTDRHRWKFVAHLDDIRDGLEDIALRKPDQPVSHSFEVSSSKDTETISKELYSTPAE